MFRILRIDQKVIENPRGSAPAEVSESDRLRSIFRVREDSERQILWYISFKNSLKRPGENQFPNYPNYSPGGTNFQIDTKMTHQFWMFLDKKTPVTASIQDILGQSRILIPYKPSIVVTCGFKNLPGNTHVAKTMS